MLDSQDEKRSPVRADLPVTLHQFIQLQAHQARHSCCGGGYGWDDPSSNALALQRQQRNVLKCTATDPHLGTNAVSLTSLVIIHRILQH